MRPIATDSVAWFVCRSVCHGRESCKNGWTDHDVTWLGPSNLCSMRSRSKGPGRGTFAGMTSGFFRMMPSTISSGPDVGISLCAVDQRFKLPIGQSQKQSSVILNFPNEESPAAMRPLVKILWPLVFSYACRELLMLQLLSSYGPLTVGVDASNWVNYQGGIIRYHCGEVPRNHAVQIVGYDLTG